MDNSYKCFIKELYTYLDSNNYLETETLSNINGAKVGISGRLIKQILQRTSIKSPLYTYYHGYNEAETFDAARRLLKCFQTNNITSTIVIEGLPYNNKKEEIVKCINKDLEEKDLKYLDLSGIEITDDYLFEVLNEVGFDVIFAPYSAGAQLKYMFSQDFINCVMDDIDFLIYCQDYPSFSNLIVSCDCINETFEFFDLKKFMMKTSIKIKNLHSFFIIGGIVDKKSFFNSKDLEDKSNLNQILKFFKSKEELNTIFDEEGLKKFNSHKKIYENMLILNSSGEIEGLSSDGEYNLSEIGKIFGNALPNEFYVYFMNGMINKDLATFIMYNRIITRPFFCDSLELRKSIDKSLNTQFSRIICYLTSNLSPNYKCSYEVFRHYLIEKSFIIEYKDLSKEDKEISHFKIQKRDYNLKFGAISFSKLFIQQYLTDSKSPKRHRLFSFESDLNSEDSRSESGPDTYAQICANAFRMFFKLNYYIDFNDEPTIHLSALRKCEIMYEEEIILILELLKSDCSHLFDNPFCSVKNLKKIAQKVEIESLQSLSKGLLKFEAQKSDNLKKGIKESESKYIYCISRVFSLVPANLITLNNDITIANDIDCAKFKSIVEYFQKKSKDQFESILWFLFSSGHYVSYPEYINSFKQASKTRPFCKGVNISLGILVKDFLQGKIRTFDEELKASFKHGFRLWSNIVYILEYQSKKSGKKSHHNKLFEEADIYLHQKFKEVKII